MMNANESFLTVEPFYDHMKHNTHRTECTQSQSINQSINPGFSKWPK